MHTENDNIVPEMGVTGFSNPSLDADPIDNNLLDELDKLPDEAPLGEEPSPANPPDEGNPGEDESFLNDGLNGGDPAPAAETTPANDTSAAPVSTPPEDPSAPGDKTPDPEQPVQDATEIDPEIAAIEQPRNLSESNQSNWKKLQETASRYKKEALEAEQLRQRVVELEQRPSQAPADYEELKKFRQIFDLKNDPEFHSKYETPIKQAKESIYSILKKNGASDETIASIEKVGGPDKVSDTWWKQNVIDKLQLTDAEKLKRNLVDVIDLKERQEKEIAETAEKAEEILAARKNEQFNWYQKENEGIEKTLSEITKDVPWARYKEAPKDASPEDIAQIQKHNAKVQDLHQKFQSALWPTDARARTEIAAAATFSHVLADQLRYEQSAKAQLEAKIKALETENSQLKQAGRAPKPSANSTSSKPTAANDRWKMNAGDAIDMGLDEAGA